MAPGNQKFSLSSRHGPGADSSFVLQTAQRPAYLPNNVPVQDRVRTRSSQWPRRSDGPTGQGFRSPRRPDGRSRLSGGQVARQARHGWFPADPPLQGRINRLRSANPRGACRHRTGRRHRRRPGVSAVFVPFPRAERPPKDSQRMMINPLEPVRSDFPTPSFPANPLFDPMGVRHARAPPWAVRTAGKVVSARMTAGFSITDELYVSAIRWSGTRSAFITPPNRRQGSRFGKASLPSPPPPDLSVVQSFLSVHSSSAQASKAKIIPRNLPGRPEPPKHTMRHQARAASSGSSRAGSNMAACWVFLNHRYSCPGLKAAQGLL